MDTARNLWEESNPEENKPLWPVFKKCNNRLLCGVLCRCFFVLIAKPGNYAKVCMPIVEKVGRESELLLFQKSIGICWNVDYSDIMDCCCQDVQ